MTRRAPTAGRKRKHASVWVVECDNGTGGWFVLHVWYQRATAFDDVRRLRKREALLFRVREYRRVEGKR